MNFGDENTHNSNDAEEAINTRPAWGPINDWAAAAAVIERKGAEHTVPRDRRSVMQVGLRTSMTFKHPGEALQLRSCRQVCPVAFSVRI